MNKYDKTNYNFNEIKPNDFSYNKDGNNNASTIFF